MLSELRVWSLIAITGAIWLALAAANIVAGNTDGLSVIVDLLPLLLLVGLAFERRGWRAQWLHPRWVSTPVVIGTWRGTLTHYSDDATPTDKRIYLTVRQTLTKASVRMLTDESTSEQVAGGPAKTEADYPAIAYTYRNKPGVGLRHADSDIHYGGSFIEIVGSPATGLDGEYWTERRTKGKLTLREHNRATAQTFEEAEKLTYSTPRPLRVLE
jgi:hypothetical protein